MIRGILELRFLAKSEGTHRVCYKIGDESDYVTEEFVCNAETVCIKTIELYLDNEACTNEIIISGYVQPTCLPITSTKSRTAFKEKFYPDYSCERYVLTCEGSPIKDVFVSNYGNALEYTDDVIVTTSSSGAEDATVQLKVNNTGEVHKIDIVSGGMNYKTEDAVKVIDADENISFTQATGFVSEVDSNGSITKISILKAGYDILNPVILIESVNGKDAVLKAAGKGMIYDTVIMNAGSNFKTIPSFKTIGSARINVTSLGYCKSGVISKDCSGNDLSIMDEQFLINDHLVICKDSSSSITLPDGWVYEKLGCCGEECKYATLRNNTVDKVITFSYIDCTGNSNVVLLDPFKSEQMEVTVCVIPNSVFVINDGSYSQSDYTIMYGSDCVLS